MSELLDFLLTGGVAENGFIARLTVSIILILVGWLVALVVRALLERSMRVVIRFLSARYPSSAAGASRVQKLAGRVLPRIVYWFIILFALAMGTETMGLSIFTAWLAQLMTYLPMVLTAALLVFGGVWLGIVLKEMVARAAAAARLPYARVLGGLCQVSVIVAAGFIAANQLGIDLSFLTTIVGIILASLLLAVTLAFGLGANTMVSNIISCHYIQGLYRVGDVVEIDGVKGTIIKLTGAFVVIETESGLATVPARNFSKSISTQVSL